MFAEEGGVQVCRPETDGFNAVSPSRQSKSTLCTGADTERRIRQASRKSRPQAVGRRDGDIGLVPAMGIAVDVAQPKP
ncbi:hypothetical protein VCV18_008364 [Metarhizium anisopliae]